MTDRIKVIVKFQRPLFSSTGSRREVMSYIVGEDDEQLSNPYTTRMKERDIKKLFGEYYKVYYLCWHTNGKPVEIIEPIKEDEWV